MKYFFTFSFLLCFVIPSFAQRHLPGLWTGYLTQGENEYKVEMVIVRNRQTLTGRSYIHLQPNEVVEMEIKGYLHDDLSMNIYDVKLVEPNIVNDSIHFPRHFQLIYNRSYNDMQLTGYWQDWHWSASDPKRKQGRIVLEKKAIKA